MILNLYRYILVISAFLCWGCLSGQELAYEHFRVGKEISFSSVYSNFVQDSLGYIWIGSDQGLYSYGGKQFKHYPIEKSIIDQEMLFIEMSPDGTLIALNLAKQILYLAPGADTLRLMQLPDFIQGKTISMDYFNQDTIQITCNVDNDQLVYLMKVRGSDPPKFSLLEKRFGNNRSIFFDQNKNIYTLEYTDSDNIELHIQPADSSQGEIKYAIPFKIDGLRKFKYLSQLKTLVVSSVLGDTGPLVFVKKENGGNFHELKKEGWNRLSNIFDDPQGNIWICTDNGLKVYDSNLKPLYDGEMLFPGFIINNIKQDQEGAYWVGTEKNGMFYIANPEAQYYSAENSQLLTDNITSLYQTGDVIYGGTLAGHIFRIHQGKIEPLYSNNKSSKRNSFITDLGFDQGKLIVTQNVNSPYALNVDSGALRPLLDSPSSFKVTCTHRGRIILGKTRGTILLSDDPEFKELSTKHTTALHSDERQDRVWIGEIGGLKYYDFTDNQLHTFQPGNNPFDQYVWDITQDSSGLIWLSTTSEGIFGIQEDSIVYHFTTQDGLISNRCRKLILDEENDLWVGTDVGISRIDLQTLAMQNIDRSHGLLVEDVIDLARLEQDLWVGTTSGLFRIPIPTITTTLPPSLHITKFKIWEKEQAANGDYQLSHQDNNLYIEFHGINFKNMDKLNYQYRMLGVDSNWTRLPAHINFVRYPQLQAGTYRFEVQALNPDGLASPTRQIDIEIKSAIWQRWWFILLLLTAIFGVAQFAIHSYRRQRAREQRYLQRIEFLRAASFRTQMNPHFIFNTLNAILYYLSKNDWSTSVNYLSKFSKLIRSIFDHSKYDLISLTEEIKFLESYLELEQLRFIDRVKIHIDLEDHLRTSSFQVPPLLIQPLLENAFKHGLFHKEEPGNLYFSIKEEDAGIIFIIEDDGVGREQAAFISQRRGRSSKKSSTPILRERIELMNSQQKDYAPYIDLKIKDLYNANKEAVGTRCTVTIYNDPIMAKK